MKNLHLEIELGAESPPAESLDVLDNVAQRCISAEGITLPCAASVLLVNDEKIRMINQEKRCVNQITDVLSFPYVNYPRNMTAVCVPSLLRREWDDTANACMLGDIVISLPRAVEQARINGHTEIRELAYLLTHGLFHLMGYDHITREGKTAMRKMEEKALKASGMSRTTDTELLSAARKALESAYVPYSKYRVGACILSKDGRMFTGCNVENASYGLTNCAERTAVYNAISEGVREFETIAIAAEKSKPWPCGACRQVLNEFCPDIRILVALIEGEPEETFLSELLPHSFGPAAGTLDYLGKE